MNMHQRNEIARKRSGTELMMNNDDDEKSPIRICVVEFCVLIAVGYYNVEISFDIKWYIMQI